MKALVILAAVFVSTNAFAIEDMTCKGNKDFGTSETVSVQIKAVGKTTNQVPEGTSVPYKITVKNDGEVWADGVVSASQEDVMFGFEGAGSFGELSGMIYLDELEQSHLSLNDMKLQLDCRGED